MSFTSSLGDDDAFVGTRTPVFMSGFPKGSSGNLFPQNVFGPSSVTSAARGPSPAPSACIPAPDPPSVFSVHSDDVLDQFVGSEFDACGAFISETAAEIESPQCYVEGRRSARYSTPFAALISEIVACHASLEAEVFALRAGHVHMPSADEAMPEHCVEFDVKDLEEMAGEHACANMKPCSPCDTRTLPPELDPPELDYSSEKPIQRAISKSSRATNKSFQRAISQSSSTPRCTKPEERVRTAFYNMVGRRTLYTAPEEDIALYRRPTSMKQQDKQQGDHDEISVSSSQKDWTGVLDKFSSTWAVSNVGSKNLRMSSENVVQRWLDEQSRLVGREDSCLLSPVGRFRMCWDIAWSIFLLYDVWYCMFVLVFTSDGVKLPSIKLMSLMASVFWVSDLAINFFTGFIRNNKIVLKRREVIKKYMKFWFWLDLTTTTVDLVDHFSSEDGRFFSTMRATKVTKAFKLVKALRFLRAKQMLEMRKRSTLRKMMEPFETNIMAFLPVLGVVGFLFLYSHIHGTLWASVHPVWIAGDDVAVSFQRYRESFLWAFCALVFGSPGEGMCTGQSAVIILVGSERILLMIRMSLWLVQKALDRESRSSKIDRTATQMLSYLRGRNISVKTQVRMLYSINETAESRLKLQNFQTILQHLPTELRRHIYDEMWSPHLLTLELIRQIVRWHEDLVGELSLIVREEAYPSDAIICREGDFCTIAYHVLQGSLAVLSSESTVPLNDIRKGMWIGEKAFISTAMRFSATYIATSYCTLLELPASSFHELLDRFGVMKLYRIYCADDVINGFCGRCGSVGHHFSDNCGVKHGSSSSLYVGLEPPGGFKSAEAES